MHYIMSFLAILSSISLVILGMTLMLWEGLEYPYGYEGVSYLKFFLLLIGSLVSFSLSVFIFVHWGV